MTSSYASLIRTLNPVEGSETHERLQKLQELEQLRKERDAKRQQRLAATQGEPTVSIRYTRSRSRNYENLETPSTFGVRRTLSNKASDEIVNPFDNISYDDYGGARPKNAGLSSQSGGEEGDISSVFSSLTESILGTSRSKSGSSDLGSDYSSSRRQPGHGEVSSTSSRYDRPSYTDTTYESRPYFSRSNSESKASQLADNRYERRLQRRREKYGVEPDSSYPTSSETTNDGYDETFSQNDGNTQHSEETVDTHHDVNDYEEGEEPKHFIERLKSSVSNGSPLNHKRGANNDYIISTIPSVPPLKRQKPELSSDIPDLVEPLEDDILAVAKDIRRTFGIKSPKSSESSAQESANDDTKHFDFSSSNIDLDTLNNGGNTTEDFVFTAKIAAAKGRQSGNKRRSQRSSGINHKTVIDNDTTEDPNTSVTYEIQYEDYDSSGDDEGKTLPVSDAFNRSAWIVSDHSPGKIDQIHEYFQGEEIHGDPVINRELNGSYIKAELEESFSERDKKYTQGVGRKKTPAKSPEQQKGAMSTLKNAFSNLVQNDSNDKDRSSSSTGSSPEQSSEKSPNKAKKQSVKGTPVTRDKDKNVSTPTFKKKDVKKNKMLDKVKAVSNGSKSSDSDNDSFQTASESESENRSSRRASSGTSTPTKLIGDSSKSIVKNKSESNLTLSDKLAKLESMTQEKSRKKSIGESDGNKRPVPSYMSGTSASQRRQNRAKSPAGLVKDVRELKQFIHEHNSETNTPIHTPSKQVITNGVKKTQKTLIVKEIGVQTDIDSSNTNEKVYVCLHCGNSSAEKVGTPVAEYQTDGEDNESLDRYETRSDTGYSFRSGKTKTSKLNSANWNTEKNIMKRGPATGRSYMKGTTASLLKNSVDSSTEKVRKSSVPDTVYRNRLEDSVKSKQGKSIVAQRAKEIEIAAKKGEQRKLGLSVFRANSAERKKSVSEKISNGRSKLSKSKSVEQVYMTKGKSETVKMSPVEIDFTQSKTDINSNTIKVSPESKDDDLNNATVASPGEKRSRFQMLQKSPDTDKQAKSQVGNEKLASPRPETNASPKAGKPPVVSPKPKRTDIDKSQRIQSPTTNDEVFQPSVTVDSKGQFTRLENNPFIRNDQQRRNSLKGRNEGESVWEKSSEDRSRDSSLHRSTSSADGMSPIRKTSLKRSNTSAGERSSLSQLNWSDSGSSESLHATKSSHSGSRSTSLHDSSESLNNRSAFQRPRSSSSVSNCSQNAMLNLLSPVGTTRNPVTGALETDVDAAYKSDKIDSVDKADTVEHNEETVNRTHLEFAKNACNMLEFETKKRDSSNESQDGTVKSSDNESVITNGHGNETVVNGKTNNVEEKNRRKGKGKRGFFKGKMFKK